MKKDNMKDSGPRIAMTAAKAATPGRSLAGRSGLVLGIANDQSIAYGCAAALRAAGAELALTYRSAKTESQVRALARQLDCPSVMPCDVEHPEEMEAVFDRIRQQWGRLDFAVHSIAFAPKTDLSSTARGRVSCGPWTFRAIRSSAWRGWRNL